MNEKTHDALEKNKKKGTSDLRKGYRSARYNMMGYTQTLTSTGHKWVPDKKLRQKDPAMIQIVKAEKILHDEDYIFSDNPFGRSHHEHPYGKGYALAVGNKLMKNDHFDVVLTGALVYEKIGQGNRDSIKRRLLRAYEHALEEDPKGTLSRFGRDVRAFLERNSKKSGLEGRIVTVSLIFILVVSFFFVSPNLVGSSVAYVDDINVSYVGLLWVFVLLAFSVWNYKKL